MIIAVNKRVESQGACRTPNPRSAGFDSQAIRQIYRGVNMNTKRSRAMRRVAKNMTTVDGVQMITTKNGNHEHLSGTFKSTLNLIKKNLKNQPKKDRLGFRTMSI